MTATEARIAELSDKVDDLIKAVISLAGHAAAGTLVGDADWRRMPAPKADCPVSGWSRSTIQRHIDAGAVRTKKVGYSRFYAGADVRRLLNQPQATP